VSDLQLMNAALQELQTRIGYTFRNVALLETALTHPAYVNEQPETTDSNQRLEFLGDAVLQLILSEELFRLYPQDREGSLTQRRKKLVEGRFLAGLARGLQLDHHLRVPASASNVAETASALEDAFEALVAAIYLDDGYANARRVVLALYGDLARHLATSLPDDNPKGRLQEHVQPQHGNTALRYVTSHIGGEDHAREYEAQVFLHDQLLGTGRGPSKKLAEEAAALVALETLKPTMAD
jgi:ribonuclease-3